MSLSFLMLGSIVRVVGRRMVPMVFGFCAASATFGQAQVPQAPAIPDDVLRVCADPNNMPLSNDKGEGFENKIAEAMARDMKRKLEYTWYPQRMGFIRSTLRARDAKTGAFKCDLIIGVPKDYELAATTSPYLRSTYALVFQQRPELASVKVADDLLKLPPNVLRRLKFGIFGRSPAADWLLANNLFEQSRHYAPQSGDPNVSPSKVVEQDLRDGTIDIAALWGSIAGSFATRDAGQWVVAPFTPSEAIQFDFEIAMGVRYGEKAWKDTIENWIKSHHSQIDAILASYRVPTLALARTDK